MSNTIVNYDGSITSTPQQLVHPKTRRGNPGSTAGFLEISESGSRQRKLSLADALRVLGWHHRGHDQHGQDHPH